MHAHRDVYIDIRNVFIIECIYFHSATVITHLQTRNMHRDFGEAYAMKCEGTIHIVITIMLRYTLPRPASQWVL